MKGRTVLNQKALLATLGFICLLGYAWSYDVAAPAPIYEAVPVAYDYGASAPKAAASKIHSAHLPALHRYGYQIGEPLLVRNYGPLTNLYSALAPKRSFIGTVDSGFYKDSYGNVKFRDETAIGAIVV